MSDQLPPSLFPRWWKVEPPPIEIVWVYLNWLQAEIDILAEEKWPILKQIRGHRRIEVIAFLEQYGDWTEGVLNTKMVV